MTPTALYLAAMSYCQLVATYIRDLDRDFSYVTCSEKRPLLCYLVDHPPSDSSISVQMSHEVRSWSETMIELTVAAVTNLKLLYLMRRFDRKN